MATIYVGLFTEGSTDIRFLSSIAQRTLEDVAFECAGQIDIDVHPITLADTGGMSFIDKALAASKAGTENFGISIFCIHTDADDSNNRNVYTHKINPLRVDLNLRPANEYCKVIVPLIPVQETEAWMLADIDLLKAEIGTDLSNQDLGLHRAPESIARPKEVIENAITIARKALPQRRRRDLNISELYLQLGQTINIAHLALLPSYIDFRNNVRSAFIELNHLHA